MKEHEVLTGHLKRLKMPGILENLDMRIKEAEENRLGYQDFLILLIQDEVANRESNNLNNRIRNGGLSPRMTIESYDFRFNAEAFPPEWLRDLMTCRFVQNRKNLVLGGPPGIGKTHIAQAIGHEVCRRGGDVLFTKTQKMLDELSNSQYPRRVERLWKRLRKSELLILDDFGFRRYDNREAEILYTIADERLGNQSTIITSNRPTQDWYGVFPDPVIGGAILDRLAAGAHKLIVPKDKAESRRKFQEKLFPENEIGSTI